MENILEVKDLCRDFGGFKLDGVTFGLPKGSVMGFIGENGAGKTTTIKLMLNMIRKDSGDVRILGLDHIENEQDIKQHIGVVLDENHFHEALKASDISAVMKNIFTEWDDGLFKKYLKKFGVTEDKTVKELSKGTKTKLSLSAALAHRPKLLILDEATGGLDPVIRSEILDIFLDVIQDEERAVFLSTHITSDLERIADYVTLIHEGRIVFSRPKDELKYGYGILKCGVADFERLDKANAEGYRKSRFGYEVLVKDRNKAAHQYPGLIIDPATIEDIMLFYVRSEMQ
jgi:ABC-2 type transport system ATP-binding protein